MRVVRLLCRALKKNKPYPKISILPAMKTIADSWEAVTTKTVFCCFKKAGIKSDVQQATIAGSEDSLKELPENLNQLRSTDPLMVSDDVTAESIVSSDDDVIPTAPEIAESYIIKELCLYQKTHVNEEKNDGDCEN